MKKQYAGDKDTMLVLLGSFWVRSYTIIAKLCKSNPKTQPLLTCIFCVFCEKMDPLLLCELVVFESRFLDNHKTSDKTLLHTLGILQMVYYNERTT